MTPAFPFRIVTSPGPGRLRLLPPERFDRGVEVVRAGQPLARLEQGAGEILIRAPIAGRVSAVLGLEGEPVTGGQAIVAIEPEPA